MKIVFANEELRDECNNQDALKKRYGAERAKLLRQRLDELFNAETLEEMRSMPHVRLISSTDGEATLALDAGEPYRLLFRPNLASGPADGSDWKKIDSIFILGMSKRDEK